MTPVLRAVDAALPDYPVPRDVRLDGNSFVKLQHRRWLQSDLHLLCTYEVQGLAAALMMLAQDQCPVGTLPDDDLVLSRLLRVELHHWQGLRGQKYGPMRGWVPCLSGGERRLMHPVVLAQVQDAIERREVRELSKSEAAERKRLDRLRDGLGKLGVSAAVLDDGVLMRRLDIWLTAHCTGNRTGIVLSRALDAAAREGWLGR